MFLNHFKLVDEPVIEPPFLVRDVDSARVVKRLKQRMEAEGERIKVPRKRTALNGMATIGLAMEQQEAVIDALTGRYAVKYWDGERAGLGLVYPIELIDFLYGDKSLPAYEARRLAKLALEQAADESEMGRALEFLVRAWELRQQVVIEGRPMSLIPTVVGHIQGDTPSFTPVVAQLDDDTWRLGWPGDKAKASPMHIEKTDTEQAIRESYRLYNDWYHRDQDKMLAILRARKDKMSFQETVYVPVWEYLLRQSPLHFGAQGETQLENISHNRLFRLRFLENGEARQTVFETSAEEAVLLAIASRSGETHRGETHRGETHRGETHQYPEVDTVTEAYLSLMGKRGFVAAIEEIDADARTLLPLKGAEALAVYRVQLMKGESVTIAWAENHAMGVAVVSGSARKVRAIVRAKKDELRLGVFPVMPKKAHDRKDVWQSSATGALDWRKDARTRRAISAWLAWVWQRKSGLKKYQT